MKLSKRLSFVTEMINDCELLADIGCDHGYVSIEAVRSGKARSAIASDTAEGPLMRARTNVEAYGLSDKITCLRSDGLLDYKEYMKPDCISITGMGGQLIKKILSEGFAAYPEMKKCSQLILGAQSDTDVLRHYLIDELELDIIKESCIYDDGKYYILMDIRHSEGVHDIYTDIDYAFGKHLDADTIDTYKKYMLFLKEKLEKAVSCSENGTASDSLDKTKALRKELSMINARLAEV